MARSSASVAPDEEGPVQPTDHIPRRGEERGAGTFRCTDCSYVLSLAVGDESPTCAGCGGTSFERIPLFSGQATTVALPPLLDPDPGDWIDGVRDGIHEPGLYLAYADGDEVRVAGLTREWTRIGRSLAADVRFDDPTVSRRHALVVQRPDAVRVLDDRSLNGVFVNGERVEWGELRDGDELVVGRHRIRFISVPHVSGMRGGEPDAPRTLAP